MTGEVYGCAGPGSALSGCHRGALRSPPTVAHCIRGCTQYALKVRGVAVGALHFKFVLFLDLEEFEDFVALQTPEFIYRHGCFSFFLWST
jgi:hypothetical protein